MDGRVQQTDIRYFEKSIHVWGFRTNAYDITSYVIDTPSDGQGQPRMAEDYRSYGRNYVSGPVCGKVGTEGIRGRERRNSRIEPKIE